MSCDLTQFMCCGLFFFVFLLWLKYLTDVDGAGFGLGLSSLR